MDEHATDQRRPLQFSLTSIFVFMTGLGFACALAPPESLPLQLYCVVYLLIGFGQAYHSLTSWLRLRRETTWKRTPSQDAAPFIQLGCWLTLPTWLLLVVLLGASQWYRLPERSEGFFWPVVVIWAFLAFYGQIGGILVNLSNCVYCFRPIDLPLRRLALLNLAHIVTLWTGAAVLWFFLPQVR